MRDLKLSESHQRGLFMLSVFSHFFFLFQEGMNDS